MVMPLFKLWLVKVNIPKGRHTYCPKCKKHRLHTVSQYRKGKENKFNQGKKFSYESLHLGKRRYDKKQKGYGGQTKPI
jgi:large subunit ribosomal protein L44e